MDAPAALRAQLTAAADALVAILLAPSCAGCERPLDHPTRGPVCEACWSSVLPLPPAACDIRGGQVSRAGAAGAYDGALRAIVHAFKYDGRRSIAATLGAMMRERGHVVLAGAHAAVPVPLHPSRRRSRGFNQADDLARHLGLAVVHALRRIRATATQADLPAAKRHGNVYGAFVAAPTTQVLRGKIVVLVDDVSTTGATLESCARALKEAGVAEVRALTAARVVTIASTAHSP
jgi:ComF family protein